MILECCGRRMPKAALAFPPQSAFCHVPLSVLVIFGYTYMYMYTHMYMYMYTYMYMYVYNCVEFS